MNFDMVGRGAPDSVFVVGMKMSTLGQRVLEVVRDHPGLRLSPVSSGAADQFFSRSDNFAFSEQGVPSLSFFGGMHADYHQPSDQVERINPAKVGAVALFGYHLVVAVANARRAPEWSEGVAEMVIGR